MRLTDELSSQWCPVEATATVEQWRRHFRLAAPQHYRAGQQLVAADRSRPYWLLLETGIATVRFSSSSGREAVPLLVLPGQLMEVQAASARSSSVLSIRAATMCSADWLPSHVVADRANQDPELARFLTQHFHRELVRRTIALADVMTLPTSVRLETILRRVGSVLGREKDCQACFKDTEMALLLGVSDRQYKRLRKHLFEKRRQESAVPPSPGGKRHCDVVALDAATAG